MQLGPRGTSIALNGTTGRWYLTPQFGRMLHENVTPVPGLSQAAFFLSEDGNAGRSQLYTYTAPSFTGAIRGRGSLRVFVPTDATDRDPSPDDIGKGGSLHGRFVPIPQRKNTDINELEAASQKLGAFDFVRIEDSEASRTHPGIVYFSDTGAAHTQTFQGRIYRLRIDPTDPTEGSLRVLLDGDHGDDMTQPDNLASSKRPHHPGGP